MAFRMKHWLGVVSVSVALVAVWRLPIGYVTPGEPLVRSAEHVRHDELSRELRDARVALDQLRRSRELPGRVLSTAVDGAAVLVPELPGDRTDLGPGLEARVRLELADLQTRAPGMVVGYAYDAARVQGSGLAVAQTYRLETYLGEEDGAPYCLQVVVARTAMMHVLMTEELAGRGWSRYTRSLLGPCAFYAKHGLAGERVQEWLASGGLHFAFGRRDVAIEGPSSLPRRSLLARRSALGEPLMLVERCLTGEAGACRTIFLEPTLVYPPSANPGAAAGVTPVLWNGVPRSGPFPAENWFLLHDLERDFGADAFRAFWTSDAEVTEAFESAFDVELGDWLLGWLDDQVGIERATPAPTFSATFGSLLFVSLLTGLATYLQRRREVT